MLITHFGDTRDLTSLIHDLNRLKQLPHESPLIFINKINAHNAKLHSCINSQQLTNLQKLSQCDMVDRMCLDTLLTGLDSQIAPIIRASNPENLVDATARIKRELQLSYLENSKSQHNKIPQNVQRRNFVKNPNNSFNTSQVKFCNYCKKNGHTINECYSRKNQNSYNNNNTTYSNNHGGLRSPNNGFNNFNRPQFQRPNQQSTYNRSSQFNNYNKPNIQMRSNHLNGSQERATGNPTPSTSAQPKKNFRDSVRF